MINFNEAADAVATGRKVASLRPLNISFDLRYSGERYYLDHLDQYRLEAKLFVEFNATRDTFNERKHGALREMQHAVYGEACNKIQRALWYTENHDLEEVKTILTNLLEEIRP